MISISVRVGDIRKAIEGLPDESFVCTSILFTDDFSEISVSFVGIKQEEDQCIVELEVREFDLDDD